MVEPVNWHPAADRSTAEALVVEQDRRVVGLSGWLADAAVETVTGGRFLQVLTPSRSHVTYPLELMFGQGGSHWVVRDGNGFRDGFTGAPMAWTGARFAQVPDSPVPAVEPVSAGHGGIEVHVVTRYPADGALELGGAADAVMRSLTGNGPRGWGVAEPATQPWSPREITAHCRDRAPSPTSLVVVGDGALGVLRVERVDSGVLERLQVSGPASGTVSRDGIDDLVDRLAPTARTALVAVHPRRVNGLRPAAPSPPALPYGILVGHEAVGERGAEHARDAPAVAVRLTGSPERPACWCLLSGGRQAPYEVLTAVLHHFGLPEPVDRG
ncbi:DUF6177 family protein [Actinosynnema sp. NPDC023794]